MANYTGTVLVKGRAGDLGQQMQALGEFDLADGGAGLADTDTITWTGLLQGSNTKIVGFKFYGVEIDTNATPTATFTIGDGTDADGYLTTKGGAVGLQNSLGGQLVYFGDGALIGTEVSGKDVVLTVTEAVATTATTGKIYVSPIVEGV